MDFEDLKNKSTDELKELLAETRTELQKLRFEAHAKQLKQVHKISAARQTIARIMTLLTKQKNKKTKKQP